MKRGLNKNCHLFFSTLANPTRLAIVELLREGPLNVTQISRTLGQEASMISHNLNPLLRCGFIFAEKNWKERVYSLNEETAGRLFKLVDDHVEKYCNRGLKANCH